MCIASRLNGSAAWMRRTTGLLRRQRRWWPDMSAQGYMAIVAGMALLGAAAAWPLENPGDQSPRVTQEGLSDLAVAGDRGASLLAYRSEEHTTELQSLMRISYA